MGYAAQRNIIQTKFQTEFSAAYPYLPIIFDNVKGKEPENGFVILNILNGDSILKSMGATKLYRHLGVVSVDFYSPLKIGMKEMDEFTDTVVPMFRGQQVEDIVFGSPYRVDLGQDENYWRVNISIPFRRDELV